MSSRRKGQRRGICPYCLREKNLTEEHVIPHTLYAPGDNDKVVIDICHQCNNRMSASIRDLRNLIVLSLQDTDNPDIDHHILKILNTNQETRDWLLRTITTAEQFDYVDEEGKILGVGLLPQFNKERARLAVAQIVRGLYFYETGSSLPVDCPVSGFDIPAPFAPRFIHHLTQHPHEEAISSGNNVATWVMFSKIEGGGVFDSAWLLMFLGGTCFVAGTGTVAQLLEKHWQEMLDSENSSKRVNGRLQMRAPILPDGSFYVPPQ